MSQESETKKVFIAGIYNWPASITKEERHTNKEYPRHNWCDIDTTDIQSLNSVLAVFKKYHVSCISQICGKGSHVFGDEVPFVLWLQIWNEIRPFADPLWQPHTLRISKKRESELFEQPIFHGNGRTIQPWMKAVMSFLCKTIRGENSNNLWNAMHNCGIHKYFQGTVYPVELPING